MAFWLNQQKDYIWCVCVWLFVTLWTVACQAPLSMGFSRQEYWSGLPCPLPWYLPNPGIKPVSPGSAALANAQHLDFSLLRPWPVQFSRSVLSNSLQSHGLQHARLPCPLPTPRAYSNSCPSSQWCHPTISSSVVPFSSRLPSFPASGSFQMSSVLHIRWPKYWSFSFSISPSNECSGLISFRMDWLDLLAVQGTLNSLLQHHSSKASILVKHQGLGQRTQQTQTRLLTHVCCFKLQVCDNFLCSNTTNIEEIKYEPTSLRFSISLFSIMVFNILPCFLFFFFFQPCSMQDPSFLLLLLLLSRFSRVWLCVTP